MKIGKAISDHLSNNAHLETRDNSVNNPSHSSEGPTTVHGSNIMAVTHQ